MEAFLKLLGGCGVSALLLFIIDSFAMHQPKNSSEYYSQMIRITILIECLPELRRLVPKTSHNKILL